MKNYELFRVLGITACGAVFLAASCEQKKPDPPPTNPTNNTTGGVEPTTTATEVLKPDDVGPRADAVFMLSSLKGYTEPCGCTLDIMLGGIDRIAGYVGQAKPLYKSVTVVDGGDLFFETATLEEHEIPQEKAKVGLVVQGLAQIGVQVTVPGERDFALGTAYYLENLAAAKIRPIAANLQISDQAIDGSWTHGATLYVGIVDPALFDGIEGVVVTDPKGALDALAPKIEAADAAVLLVHGDVSFAKKVLNIAQKADFALIGHAPRETDQVDAAGGGFTLEPYDQGRYLGILKLYNSAGAASKSFVDARPGSKAELEKIGRQIEHVDESINKMPPAAPGKESTMLLTLRKRLDDLRARRTKIQNAAVDVPADSPAFLWRSIPLEPEYPPDPDIEKLRNAYNLELKRLNGALDREIPPVPNGGAGFVGTARCATCHGPAESFWSKTAHSRAWTTLVDRQKDFDQKCVGCHVVGYEQPGGSVVGKVEQPDKSLANVGCESCHGAGSLHAASPVDAAGKAQNILVSVSADQCQQCHVPEHSPRFRFETYVDQITGPGHAP